MRPKAFADIITEESEGFINTPRAKNAIAVLSKESHLNGYKDLEPHQAGLQAYLTFACPTSYFHSAFQWFGECRRAWMTGGANKGKDLPAFAMKVLITNPEEIKRLKIKYLVFTDDFRLIILREGFTDILPKGLYSFETGKVVDTQDLPAQRATLVPAEMIYRIAKRLGLKIETPIAFDEILAR